MCQAVGKQQRPLVCLPSDTDALVGETGSRQMPTQLKRGVTCRECWRGIPRCRDVERMGPRGSGCVGRVLQGRREETEPAREMPEPSPRTPAPGGTHSSSQRGAGVRGGGRGPREAPHGPALRS